MTKRFSAVARANRSSFHSLHFRSEANEGEAATAARVMTARRKNFMAFPDRHRCRSELRSPYDRGSGRAAMSRESERFQVEAFGSPAAFTSSRSSEAAPGPAIASHRKAPK